MEFFLTTVGVGKTSKIYVNKKAYHIIKMHRWQRDPARSLCTKDYNLTENPGSSFLKGGEANECEMN